MTKIKVTHIWKDFDTYNGMVEILLFIAEYHNRDLFDLGACVFTYNGSEHGEMFQKAGATLHSLDCGNGIAGHLKFFPRLTKFLRREKPDGLVTHDRRANLFGILAGKFLKVPVIVSMETTLKDSATSPVRRARDKLLHPILLPIIWSSDAFISTSYCIRRQWLRKSSPSKFRVLYPPFNLKKYQSAKTLPERHEMVPRPFPTLGYVGRLSEEKGLHYLISALPQVKKTFPEVKLLIAGSGEMEESFRELAKDRGVDSCTLFLGFQKNPFEVMRQIDLLVLPSRTEGCPIVLLEAMAMGVPVIASNVGGVPELVTNEVGRLIPPKDSGALAQATTDLLSQSAVMRSMSTTAKKRAFTDFHPERFVRSLEELYLEILRHRSLQIPATRED
jgi:glycosyltransferase involved in cell wall biosynthesis